jgi:hypothetical protein
VLSGGTSWNSSEQLVGVEVGIRDVDVSDGVTPGSEVPVALDVDTAVFVGVWVLVWVGAEVGTLVGVAMKVAVLVGV